MLHESRPSGSWLIFDVGQKMSTAPDDSWEKTWDARVAALEHQFGKSANNVFHAVLPFAFGGQADVVVFPGYEGGVAYITSELTGSEVGQIPSEIGTYELMICTRKENTRAAELVANLASYTCEAAIEPVSRWISASFSGIGAFAHYYSAIRKKSQWSSN